MICWTFGENTDISFFENISEIPVYPCQSVNPI